MDYISYFIETTLTVVDENGNTARVEMNASVVVEVFREEVKKKQEDQSHGGPKKSIFSAIIKESIKVVQLPRKCQTATSPFNYSVNFSDIKIKQVLKEHTTSMSEHFL